MPLQSPCTSCSLCLELYFLGYLHDSLAHFPQDPAQISYYLRSFPSTLSKLAPPSVLLFLASFFSMVLIPSNIYTLPPPGECDLLNRNNLFCFVVHCCFLWKVHGKQKISNTVWEIKWMKEWEHKGTHSGFIYFSILFQTTECILSY